MYEYGNTRLRALKSRLFPRSEIEGFANSSNFDELIDLLLGTSYRRSMEDALSWGRGVRAVTRATHFEMTQLMDRMRDYYEGRSKEMIQRMFRRFDVDNVKAILRGLGNSLSSEEIAQAFTAFGNFDKKLLMEIAGADDPRAAIDRMASMQLELADPLMTYRVERPGAALQELEIALERWHVEDAVRELKKPRGEDKAFLTALKMDVDLSNLMLVLRFVQTPAQRQLLENERDKQVADLLLDRGNLSMSRLMKAAQEDSMAKAVSVFEHSAYDEALANGLQLHQKTGRLSDIERELRRYRLACLRKQIMADPLGISVPMGVMALKANEGANIRWVAWGLQMGLPSNEIVAELEVS